MEASRYVPGPEPGETLEVLTLLEAGARSWAEGRTDEALRHFSHAAEAAGEAGDDRRALSLARSVAELRDRLAREGAAKPEAPAPSPAPPAAGSAPPSMKPPPAPSAQAKARSMPPPPPSSRAASMTPPPRAASVPPKLPASEQSPSVTPPPAAKRPSTPPIPEPAAARPAQKPSVTPERAASPEPASTVGAAPGDALRVSVKSSVRDPDLLIVRVLRKGQTAPPGTREAVLTGANLTSVQH